jgi:hypothetical protein
LRFERVQVVVALEEDRVRLLHRMLLILVDTRYKQENEMGENTNEVLGKHFNC